MSTALVTRQTPFWRRAIPAVASGFIPGLGQLINRDTDKALGVFVVAAVSGAGFVVGLPIIGGIAGLVSGATWVYGVADGYFSSGKRKANREPG
ncbi:MAG TPA: hypothetical protein VFG83_06215 [Kofleriaceae bacterium]|nr:hypothetical protein [Kofleriaceae bacterium]